MHRCSIAYVEYGIHAIWQFGMDAVCHLPAERDGWGERYGCGATGLSLLTFPHCPTEQTAPGAIINIGPTLPYTAIKWLYHTLAYNALHCHTTSLPSLP